MANTVTIDVGRLNAAIARGLPEFQAKVAAKPEKNLHPEVVKAITVGFAGIPGTGVIDTAQANFCTAWPKARMAINGLLRVAGWVPGVKNYVPLIKSVIGAINDEIFPAICQGAKP